MSSKRGKPAGKGDSDDKKDTGKGTSKRTNPEGMKGRNLYLNSLFWNMITGEAGASKRGSSGGDATTTSNIRVEQFPGHEEFSKEIRKMEAKGALD